MPGPAVDVISRFGAVEDDQRYTRLVELFTDDAVYYDPFHGPQRGREQITSFMELMERAVPASGIRFDAWEVAADTVCGWARWTMVGPGPDGVEVPVPGQSLYRLTPEGKVCFVADYVDRAAMGRLRPGAPAPDAASAAGISAPFAPDGSFPALDLVRRFWEIQDAGDYPALTALFTDDAVFTDLVYGEFHGAEAIGGYMQQMAAEMPRFGISFELVDAAGDTTVAWSQWNCRFPGGVVPGWTLHRVRDGRFTLDSDYFDTVAARALSST